MDSFCGRFERSLPQLCSSTMGRKRDLKNVYPKRPPALLEEDPEALNEWGEELHRMTAKRRRTHENHKPKGGV